MPTPALPGNRRPGRCPPRPGPGTPAHRGRTFTSFKNGKGRPLQALRQSSGAPPPDVRPATGARSGGVLGPVLGAGGGPKNRFFRFPSATSTGNWHKGPPPPPARPAGQVRHPGGGPFLHRNHRGGPGRPRYKYHHRLRATEANRVGQGTNTVFAFYRTEDGARPLFGTGFGSFGISEYTLGGDQLMDWAEQAAGRKRGPRRPRSRPYYKMANPGPRWAVRHFPRVFFFFENGKTPGHALQLPGRRWPISFLAGARPTNSQPLGLSTASRASFR